MQVWSGWFCIEKTSQCRFAHMLLNMMIGRSLKGAEPHYQLLTIIQGKRRGWNPNMNWKGVRPVEEGIRKFCAYSVQGRKQLRTWLFAQKAETQQKHTCLVANDWSGSYSLKEDIKDAPWPSCTLSRYPLLAPCSPGTASSQLQPDRFSPRWEDSATRHLHPETSRLHHSPSLTY